jgi:hypothetical protein
MAGVAAFIGGELSCELVWLSMIICLLSECCA